MTFFLGCDVAKTKLDVSLVNEQGVEQWHDVVPNEAEAIATYLLTMTGAHPDAQFCGVVEATSILHLPFAETCYRLSVPCRVYNPILTRQQIKASVRGKKTDRTDALAIARMGLRGEGRLYVPEAYLHTKHAARAQQQLSLFGTSLQLYRRHLEDVLATELDDTTAELLENIQTAIANAKRQFVLDTAARAPAGLMRLLRTIPGIGPYIAASLIGEIQDIQRFDNCKALIAYAGLDPKIKQSGKSLNSTGRLTKRGSSYLRRSLFIAANIARRYDPQLQALYGKKRAEGKTHKVATCVVARKLLAIVYAVWKSGKDYYIPETILSESA